ncbi:GGDEF domain-containing protein [Pseudomonas sp.]|uniref:GGDEF domain-containing protein n=1 Tax=Pseudomonas sp. TaxID=306 RepID=UPI0028AB7DC9|nr:GGDEF domain-containing protein [Pseudomonas sp.]
MLAPVPDSPRPQNLEILTAVERRIALGGMRLRFDDELERRYDVDTRKRRLRFLTAVGIGGACVYNLFLISDWLALHDMFNYVALGRVGLITPMIMLMLLISQRLTARWALETVSATGTVLASLMPLLVMIHSASPYRLHYQLGMSLLMVYCTMIQQLPVRYAAAALGCMLVIQLVTTWAAGFMDTVIWQANAIFYVSTAVLLLMASYFLERGSRLSYLFALRGRLLQEQLTEMARTDPLTRLFNRRYQGEVIASIWEQALRTPTRVAVILLDIDHFKTYNDSYGHMQGDTCLKLLSHTIHHTAQAAGGLAFRFGGEEMLILMVGADANQTRNLAEALRTAVHELNVPHPVLGNQARVSISLGLAEGVAPSISAGALIGSADTALYAAKRAGRNCLRCA